MANEIITNYQQACKDVAILKKIAIERYSLDCNMKKLLSIINQSEQCHIDLEKYSVEIEHYSWLLGELLCLYDNKSKNEANLCISRMELKNINEAYFNIKSNIKKKMMKSTI